MSCTRSLRASSKEHRFCSDHAQYLGLSALSTCQGQGQGGQTGTCMHDHAHLHVSGTLQDFRRPTGGHTIGFRCNFQGVQQQALMASLDASKCSDTSKIRTPANPSQWRLHTGRTVKQVCLAWLHIQLSRGNQRRITLICCMKLDTSSAPRQPA